MGQQTDVASGCSRIPAQECQDKDYQKDSEEEEGLHKSAPAKVSSWPGSTGFAIVWPACDYTISQSWDNLFCSNTYFWSWWKTSSPCIAYYFPFSLSDTNSQEAALILNQTTRPSRSVLPTQNGRRSLGPQFKVLLITCCFLPVTGDARIESGSSTEPQPLSMSAFVVPFLGRAEKRIYRREST